MLLKVIDIAITITSAITAICCIERMISINMIVVDVKVKFSLFPLFIAEKVFIKRNSRDIFHYQAFRLKHFYGETWSLDWDEAKRY